MICAKLTECQKKVFFLGMPNEGTDTKSRNSKVVTFGNWGSFYAFQIEYFVFRNFNSKSCFSEKIGAK